MKVYKSKKDAVLLIPMLLILVSSAIVMACYHAWPGFAIVLMTLAFIIHLFAKTYYSVENTTLNIQCGFFTFRPVNITTIKEIKETRSMISAPATSLDRIEIRYNRFDSIIISPKEKQEFIDHLIRINPDIKLL